MPIDSRRESGVWCAPPMRQGFDLPGVMVMQHPSADQYATMFECLKLYPYFNYSSFGTPVLRAAVIVEIARMEFGVRQLYLDGEIVYDGDQVVYVTNNIVPAPVVTQI